MKFTIEDIDRDKQSIYLELKFDNDEILALEVTVFKFYLWLERNDRLDWVYDTQDYKNEHVQETGRYANGGQFWRMASEETKKMNLTDYIIEENLIEKHFEIS